MKIISNKSTIVVRDVDSNWSWVVCLASFLIQFITIGIQSSFGTFFIEFLKEFKHGESSTAWIGSLSFGLTFMNGPLATAMCCWWGSRTIACLGAVLSFCGLMMTSFVKSFPLLYITYGVVFGLGSSFSYFASIAGLTSYFKKRLSFAYGITLAGSGAGTPIMILFLEYLIQRYGWRATFQFTAAVTSIVFLGGLTYLPIDPMGSPSPPHKDVTSRASPRTDGPRSVLSRACAVLRKLMNIFDLVPFKDRAFTVWVVALGFCIFGYFIPFVFVIRMAKDIGVSSTNSTLLIAYLAITQTISKVIFGRLGDFAREKRISILQVFLLLQAIVTMLCPLASKYGYIVLVIYVVVFGLSDGCWSVMIGMGTELIVGKAMMPRAFGSLYGLISIPLILGPPIAGVIFDQYGSYDAAFILAGVTVFIGIALMLVVQRLIQGRHQHERSEDLADTKPDFTGKRNEVELENIDSELINSRADSHYLIPVHRRLIVDTELYSRPSSLVISRVLEDMHWNEDSDRRHNIDVENFIKLDTGLSVNSSFKEETVANESDVKDLYSIGSDESRARVDRGSMNSDSGRSTYCESESLNSRRSRVCSTDSDFEDDTTCLYDGDCSRLHLKELHTPDARGGLVKSDDSASLSSSFGDDIFSDLMERTLEAEGLYCEKVKAGYDIDLPSKVESASCYRGIQNFRETVL